MDTEALAAAGRDVPPFAIPRPALVDRLDEALGRPVVLVVAPAGSGKSVLLGQWARAHPERRVVWVSARGIGVDAVRFARRLRDALVAADPAAAATLGWLPGTVDRLGPVFVDHLVEQLEQLPGVVLVIEDFEELRSGQVQAEIGQIADRLPADARLVIASRRDPVGMHRSRLRDEVAELRQDDLAMTDDEVRQVVEGLAGLHLRSDQAAALTGRTEGWAAGIQLAALALRDRDDVDRYLEEFSGDDRHVADYLGDEILEGLEPEERAFLLATSVLDRLTGPLCDALTGGDDGQRRLDSLHARSLFLVALDNRRRWYRYHPLFRDLLRYELRTERPGDEAALHLAAARWLLDAGDPAAAAAHLLDAEAWDDVIELADREGRAAFERGEAHVVLGWLEALPVDLIEGRPEVALAVVVLRLMVGQGLAAEDQAERTAQRHQLSPMQLGVVELTRLTLVYHHADPVSVIRTAQRTLDSIPAMLADPTPPLFGIVGADTMRMHALGSWARAELLQGHVVDARQRIAEAAEAVTYPAWRVHVTGTAAFCDARSGRLGRAKTGALTSLAIAEEVGLAQHPAVADAYLALARVATERGELNMAEGHLERALVAARTNRRRLLLGLQRAERAAYLVATGRRGAVAELDVEDPVGDGPTTAGTRACLGAAKARLLLAAGRTERAVDVLDRLGEWTVEVASATAAVRSVQGDLPGLRKVVNGWPERDADQPVSQLHLRLWELVLLEADGSRAEVDSAVDELLAMAEPDGHIQLFRDGGREVARILRRRYLAKPTPYLRRVVEAVADSTGATESGELVEQLSERELEVLRYLPSRLSNAEIAGRLFVSVNTLKTHLKAIYRKLGVTSRTAAVERAEELDLA